VHQPVAPRRDVAEGEPEHAGKDASPGHNHEDGPPTAGAVGGQG